MSARRVAAVAAIAAALTAFDGASARADAQALATRIAAAEGAVTVQFATRAAACGDGREFVALGTHLRMNGGYRVAAGGGWVRQPCVHGPARVVLTVRAGAVTDVAVHVGAPASDDVGRGEAARDLGPVRAADAAAYFVALAGRTAGDAAEHAVIAAAVADSADVWRPLLALARSHADERVARSAVHWLGAAAPAEAVPAVAAMLRDANVRRAVREGAAVALAFAPNGIGVPPLDAAALGAVAAGGDDPWVRDRAVFWLGNARDPRARATLRTLAAADSAPEPVRAQAIFALGYLDRGTANDGTANDGTADDGPSGGGDEPNAAFLRGLYPTLASARLQDRTIQSLAQATDAASRRWLLDLAADARQPITARTQALFWAGQRQGGPIGDLLAVDGRLTGTEIRRQYAFVLSQRREDAAVDRLIAMARNDAEPAVRRQALFWLGQSRSPRARTYLESVVAR